MKRNVLDLGCVCGCNGWQMRLGGIRSAIECIHALIWEYMSGPRAEMSRRKAQQNVGISRIISSTKTNLDRRTQIP
jgi:hypothetical protein